MASNSRVHVQSNRVAETKALISDISCQFYDLGLRKERMVRDDMYVVSSSGSKLSWPKSKPYPHKPPKCSDCAPLFLKVATYGGAIKVQANSTSSASHESIVNYTVR